MNLWIKEEYVPRNWWYRPVTSLIAIADALLDVLLWPFGQRSILFTRYIGWNMAQDAKRITQEEN